MTLALSPEYLRRLATPKGVGDLEPADRAGEVGSIVSGTGVRVTLRIAKPLLPFTPLGRRRVSAAAFRSLGSPAARGPGSVLVERVIGLDVEAARRLRAADLLAPLGDGLPEPVQRASGHLVEALSLALADGEEGELAVRAADVMAPGVLTCRCLGVGDREVRRAIRRGASDVPSIGRDCAAGTGCHSCWPDLRTLLDETTNADAMSNRRDTETDGRIVASVEILSPLAAAVDAVVRPLWRAQGVMLGRVSIELGESTQQGSLALSGLVRLSIARTDAQALASPIGAVALARHALRESLCDSIRVELSHDLV